MTNELRKQIEKYANSDLALARKKGNIGVYQTRRGFVGLTYDAQAKTYTFLVAGQKAFTGAKKDAVNFLIDELYDIQYEG